MRTHSPFPARGARTAPSAALPRSRAFAGPPEGADRLPAGPGGGHDLAAISIRPPQPGAPIQRTLSLHGEDEDRDANVARLNGLLGNSGGRVKREGANVVFDAHPDSEQGRNHASYRLLKRMIEHQHDVKIGIHPDKGAADPVMTPYEHANASKLGTGSRSFIHMPRVAPVTPVTVWDKDTQKFKTSNTPDYLQLGHELIHADHAQRGTLTPLDQTVDRRVTGELEGHGAFDTTAKEKREELVTIGLTPGHESDDITENRLRHALGHLPRAGHDRIETHLLRDVGKRFGAAQEEHDKLYQEALGHKANVGQSEASAQAAHQRMLAAQQEERGHRQSAAQNLEFVQGLRGGGPVPGIDGLTWDHLADAHQANADAALQKAETAAALAAQHERERDDHTAAFRLHRERYQKTAEAVQAKRSELEAHQAAGTKLKQRLGIA